MAPPDVVTHGRRRPRAPVVRLVGCVLGCLLWAGGVARAEEPQVQAVVFDLGGVVVSHASTLGELRWFAASSSLSLWDVLRHVRTPLARAEVGEGDFDELVERFVWSHGGRLPLDWRTRFRARYAAQTRVHEDVVALAHCLRDHGLEAALLSNTIAPHRDVDVARGAYAPFAPVVLSFEVHAAKPHAAAYHAVLGELALPPEACVMVDDRQDNVAGARATGMRGIRYASLAQLRRELRALGVAPACTAAAAGR